MKRKRKRKRKKEKKRRRRRREREGLKNGSKFKCQYLIYLSRRPLIYYIHFTILPRHLMNPCRVADTNRKPTSAANIKYSVEFPRTLVENNE